MFFLFFWFSVFSSKSLKLFNSLRCLEAKSPIQRYSLRPICKHFLKPSILQSHNSWNLFIIIWEKLICFPRIINICQMRLRPIILFSSICFEIKMVKASTSFQCWTLYFCALSTEGCWLGDKNPTNNEHICNAYTFFFFLSLYRKQRWSMNEKGRREGIQGEESSWRTVVQTAVPCLPKKIEWIKCNRPTKPTAGGHRHVLASFSLDFLCKTVHKCGGVATKKWPTCMLMLWVVT